MTDDTPNPDWVVWLARAEAEASGDEDSVLCPPLPPPDRGWQRIGDVAAKVVAGLIGGATPLALIGAALYAARVLS